LVSERTAATGKMVKITYASRAPGGAITKNLFGYKGWQTKSGKKSYPHKPMVGALQGIPFQRIGRATIVLPLSYLPKAKAVILHAGGVIRSIDPIVVDREGNKKETTEMFHDFVGRLVDTVSYAAEAGTKELFDSALDKAVALTKRFESYMAEFDEYGSVERDGQLLRTLAGLRSLSDQDFEAAKLQATFFAGDLEKSGVRI
jgi:hypothetical protein